MAPSSRQNIYISRFFFRRWFAACQPPLRPSLRCRLPLQTWRRCRRAYPLDRRPTLLGTADADTKKKKHEHVAGKDMPKKRMAWEGGRGGEAAKEHCKNKISTPHVGSHLVR